MPLSDEEMRLLEQMERHLAEEDPKFANTLRGTSIARATRTRLVLCGFSFAAGVAVMMAGAMAQLTLVGILGFLIMLGAASLGLSTWRIRHAATLSDADRARAEHPSNRRLRSPRPRGTFFDRPDQQFRRDDS